MFRFFMLIQLGLMLVGSIWMGLAGYPIVKNPDPLRDSLVFLLLFWG